MPSLPVVVSDAASRMIAALDRHYDNLGRIEAQAAIEEAVAEAARRIAADDGPFYEAPALVPQKRRLHPLRRRGWTWILTRHYWIGFETETQRHVIAAMFHESSPGIEPVRRSR